MAKLNRGGKLLYEFLRNQEPGLEVTRNELMAAMSWKESTLKTYLSKNMITPFVLELPGGDFRILHGGDRVTEGDIEAAFSQKRPSALTLGQNDLLEGSNDRYILERELGRGAVGHVWQAARESDGTTVAVKIVNPRPDLLAPHLLQNVMKRFRRESNNGMSLVHDCLIRCVDTGTFRKHPFLVMVCAEQSLKRRLTTRGALDGADARQIVRRCAHGLMYLHGLGCVHRDVKPDNILLIDGAWVLGDLGIVKWSDMNPEFVSAATITNDAIQLGSWYYMAPEQRRAPHDAVPASDVYALGVTWYELLTGDTLTPEMFAAQEIPEPAGDPAAAALIARMCCYRADDRLSLEDLLTLL